ncbi:YgaP-like transmembrane domain [Pseudomonas saudiphocaensis]|jgi:hypothetical protein|uniref:DUF2892 domain-containing protein n=1 Tax=Pseudomonas saudiphocaensis TaxID=1499686 RepID=A0A078LPN5_9PSED|nr:YgaP-like transmembrane domain [Pseudomonas saudiphocaensis]MBE7928459.1 DUF2892 domain-containing protein [Pseudomonas saudiphocaensis]CDZ93049.1 hypothetical protein BN1079_00329 [Pseudomonas saudiphocaensis]
MKQNSSTPNVHGWERAASIAGGLYFLGKGLARGGLGGILQLGLGGLALARGISGHCEAKRVLCEMNEHSAANASSSRMPEPQEADKQQMKANAQAATGTATVTGNDSLENPPAGV